MSEIKTVGELKRALEKLPDDMTLMPFLELEDGHRLPILTSVEVHEGTPGRADDQTAGFKFESPGAVKWAFLWQRFEFGDR